MSALHEKQIPHRKRIRNDKLIRAGAELGSLLESVEQCKQGDGKQGVGKG